MQRFELLRPLGKGGFGVVFEAFDRESGTVVALKQLHRVAPRSLYQFKQEFRALADVTHENLVRLYELESEGGEWFFTMERIDGVELSEWVRGPSRLDHSSAETLVASALPEAEAFAMTLGDASTGAPNEASPVHPGDTERVRSAIAQVARGLMHLHEAGKLHRDIKPNNVLVTPEGAVKILDFGLVTELGRDDDGDFVVGTPMYMAPEALTGAPGAPAQDWYAVGVMLFEALTGRVPHVGEPQALLEAKLAGAPDPRSVAPEVPDDLAELCLTLLNPDPERRLAGVALLAALGQTVPLPSPELPFVGRRDELRTLLDVLSGRAETPVVLVRGPSGMGKSRLVGQALSVAGAGALVLTSHCHAQESVPFKAFDPLVDQLARLLHGASLYRIRELVPEHGASLATLFPVLRSLPGLGGEALLGDPSELRRRAFAVLATLLERLALERPLLIFIDDLHWGDADSAALAEALLARMPIPNLRMVGTYRSEEEDSVLVQAFLSHARGGAVATLELPVLDEASARRLAETLPGVHRAQVAALVSESGGSPFLLGELGRSVGRAPVSERMLNAARLDELLLARAGELDESARRLLDTLAIAGYPLPRAVARAAAELPEGDARALAELERTRLVRVRTTATGRQLEVYHDRIREVVSAAVSDARARVVHLALATALERAEWGDPEALGLHFCRAGQPERAIAPWSRAARAALDGLAFDRAARLFRDTLALSGHSLDAERELRVGLAEALANLGHGAQAAEEFLRAADGASAHIALERRRRAAELFLNAGRMERGLAVIEEVLAGVGSRLPATPGGALAGLVARRIAVRLRGLDFVQRSEESLDPAERLAADACYSVALGLGVVDTVRAASFQAEYLRRALALGEPTRVVRALCMEVAFTSTAGVDSAARTDAILERARLLAERLAEPEGIARVTLAGGIAAFHQGRWAETARIVDHAAAQLERTSGTQFERHNAQSYGLRSLYYTGEWPELVRRLPHALAYAEERGDWFAVTRLTAWGGYLAQLTSDEPEAARAAVVGAMQRWGVNTPHQQWYRLVAEVEIAAYRGEAAQAWTLLEERWPEVRRSLQLRIQAARMVALHLRARVARTMLHSAAARLAARRALLGAARDIERANVPWAAGFAHLARAALDADEGNTERATARLERAEATLLAGGMVPYALGARYRRGELLGRLRGDALCADALAKLAARGVRAPERMLQLLEPAPFGRRTRH